MPLRIIRRPKTLRLLLDAERRRARSVAFVPTMGALHAGHAALIRRAAASSDVTVVSIYVNPLQFGPKEDFGRYPRAFKRDVAICRKAGANYVFAPSVHAVGSDARLVRRRANGRLKAGMCGPFRPGHFDGVATIVGYFFDLIRPNLAYFGLKDYQQFVIVRDLARKYFRSISVIGVPTQRERSGLALSSRNAYLSPDEKRAAAKIYSTLKRAARRARSAATSSPRVALLLKKTAEELRRIPGVTGLQYLELALADDLRPVRGGLPQRRKCVLATALFMGRTRLIDNVLI